MGALICWTLRVCGADRVYLFHNFMNGMGKQKTEELNGRGPKSEAPNQGGYQNQAMNGFKDHLYIISALCQTHCKQVPEFSRHFDNYMYRQIFGSQPGVLRPHFRSGKSIIIIL